MSITLSLPRSFSACTKARASNHTLSYCPFDFAAVRFFLRFNLTPHAAVNALHIRWPKESDQNPNEKFPCYCHSHSSMFSSHLVPHYFVERNANQTFIPQVEHQRNQECQQNFQQNFFLRSFKSLVYLILSCSLTRQTSPSDTISKKSTSQTWLLNNH